MAIIHQATIKPSKLELLKDWLPEQPWYAGGDARAVGAFRFDDPEGAVGIETHVIEADDQLYQVPLTYRAAPMEAADEWFIGTLEHSVLGTRWVYDACGDPVYAAALATTILEGGTEVEELVQTPEGDKPRTPSVSVRGSGAEGVDVPPTDTATVTSDETETIINTPDLDIVVFRTIDESRNATAGVATLAGSWSGQSDVLLATVHYG